MYKKTCKTEISTVETSYNQPNECQMDQILTVDSSCYF